MRLSSAKGIRSFQDDHFPTFKHLSDFQCEIQGVSSIFLFSLPSLFLRRESIQSFLFTFHPFGFVSPASVLKRAIFPFSLLLFSCFSFPDLKKRSRFSTFLSLHYYSLFISTITLKLLHSFVIHSFSSPFFPFHSKSRYITDLALISFLFQGVQKHSTISYIIFTFIFHSFHYS